MALTKLTHILTTPNYSQRPHLSPDGRFLVVYVEGSTAFSGGSQFNKGMVILDLADGRVVPLAPPGADSSGAYSLLVGMTWDASQVYFSARNVVDALDRTVFATSTSTGETVVAVPYPGGAPGDPAEFGLLSPNGRYSVMQADLQAGQYFPGLEWRDRETGETRPLASLEHSLRNGRPDAYSVSNDGRKVLFQSYAANVLPDGSSPQGGYFVQDMLTGKLMAVHASTGGDIGNASIFHALMSANGRYVGFNSNSSNLVAGEGGEFGAAYVKDLLTGAILRVSEDAEGKPFKYGGAIKSISADGRYVVLETGAIERADGSLAFGPILLVKDLQTGAVGQVNEAAPVSVSTVESAEISANGEMVAYMGVKMESLPSLHPVFHVFAGPRPALAAASVDAHFAGGTGADTLAGALGNDSYVVNHAGDIVIEYAGQGVDSIATTLNNYFLPEHVENLQLQGAALNGSGNLLDNLIRGTSGDNILRGGVGNDTLDGNGGSDTLYGDAGFDLVRFNGSIKDYTFTRTSWRHEVTKTGSDGAVSYLHGVEHLRFADADVTFETDGTAAMAYRLYQAAFDRKPDLAGLGYWISRLAMGTTIDEVAQSFVGSLEFKMVFGTNPTNAQLVDGMYRHVLHRAPEAAGVNFWVDVLDRGAVTRAELLKSFSESPENQDALIGVIGHGIAYTPYGG